MRETRVRKYRIKYKFIIILITFMLVLTSSGIAIKLYFDKKEEEKRIEIEKKEKELVENITKQYSEYVTVSKEAPLYVKDDIGYSKYGVVFDGIELQLEKEKITKDTKYFKITNLDKEYYIEYQAVKAIEEIAPKNNRYKKYIPFNQNVVTENKTTFYKNDDKYIEVNYSIDLPIYIKDSKKLYVEYNGELVYVLKDEVKEVKNNKNTTASSADGIPTVAYHFIYDPDKGDKCNQEICHTKKQFKSHLNYLKNNGWLTLSMDEFEKYIDGKLRLPQKSIVITIDDGWYAENAFTILTEYKMNGTVFLIGKDYGYLSSKANEYVEVHSHTYDMHKQGECPTGQGGGIQCKPKAYIIEDLKKSQEKLGGSHVFCYPFYEYNAHAISALKEAKFTMAFAGFLNNTARMKVGGNKFLIPRATIVSYHDVNAFSQIINRPY